MARLSVDDSIGRDSRLDHLAMLCGWSKRETLGCLQLDIWPLCYDRVTPNIPTLDLEIAANRGAISPVKHKDGFVGALIESKMGRRATKDDRSFEWRPKGWKDGDPVITIHWPDQGYRDRIYITGAAERIAYIAKARASGAAGGRKSAEGRKKPPKRPSKGGSSDPPSDPSRVPQGGVNPIPITIAPDIPIDVSTPPDASLTKPEEGAPAAPLQPDTPTPKRKKRARPSDWSPNANHAALTAELGVADLEYQAIKFKGHHDAKGNLFANWDQAFSNWLRNCVQYGTAQETRNGRRDDDGRFGRVAPMTNEEHEKAERPF